LQEQSLFWGILPPILYQTSFVWEMSESRQA